ncbi:MAG: TetR/AcrR family transcriptional regulator [Deltaproteobacteria bacterium]|nr:TetR/AcrR family transcriptional regulator [Deltaproteobacteria bacterium]
MKKTRPIQKRKYGGIQANLRTQERRKKLIRAGLEAFGTRGYTKTSILSICRLAGLTERYFYESFKNKEELLCTVYRKLIDEQKNSAMSVIKNFEIPPEKETYHALRMFYQLFKDDPRRTRVQLFEVLGVSKKVDREYQTAMRTLAEMMKLFLCKAFPDNSKQLNNTIVATGLAGAIIQIAHEWALDDFVTPIDEIITSTMGIFNTIGKHLRVKAVQTKTGK